MFPPPNVPDARPRQDPPPANPLPANIAGHVERVQAAEARFREERAMLAVAIEAKIQQDENQMDQMRAQHEQMRAILRQGPN